MKLPGLDHFAEVWAVDFEFQQLKGERPHPWCLAARELRAGRDVLVWIKKGMHCPIPCRSDVLFVAYYASAEFGCYLSMGWTVPLRVLDLFTEFRCLTNGLPVPCGNGQLGALAYYGLDGIEAVEKDTMRGLAVRGGPFTHAERNALMDYCATDIEALAKLLPAMLPKIDLPRAILRGRYMAAAARMEWQGIPTDMQIWRALQDQWEDIKVRLIEEVDQDFGVFEGLTFKTDRFKQYLIRHDIPWPHLESGALALDDETFKAMARTYPQIQPLRELRKTLAELRLNKLAVGTDGRNRCMLSCYRTKTGRNAPSNSRFVFGLPAWARGLIKPRKGRAVGYLDYEQQEFGIAAALSGDSAMMDAYRSGDAYLEFARQAGTVPRDATKQTHGTVRNQFKVCSLAVQYGMATASLARSLGQPEVTARHLLELHRQTYPEYWAWSQAAVDRAMLTGRLHSVFGWVIHVGENVNARTLQNFPMQANGADMLRLACCLMTERGIQVCAPVHDAVLIESDTDQIDQEVEHAQAAMQEASGVVLAGFLLRTDAVVVRHPDRYMDDRGAEMWRSVMGILRDLRGENVCRRDAPTCSIMKHLPAPP